jgi:hypothetical protein
MGRIGGRWDGNRLDGQHVGLDCTKMDWMGRLRDGQDINAMDGQDRG